MGENWEMGEIGENWEMGEIFNIYVCLLSFFIFVKLVLVNRQFNGKFSPYT